MNRHAADADRQNRADNHQIFRLHQIHFRIHQRFNAQRSDRAEQKQHDAAHYGQRDGSEEGIEFAKKRHSDGKNRRPSHNDRIAVFRNHHRARYLAVSRYRRTADQTRHTHAQAVARQRFIQARVFGVVIARYIADGHDAADVFDGGRNGDGQHKQRSLPVDLRRFKMRHGKPRRSRDGGGIHQAHHQSQNIARSHAD